MLKGAMFRDLYRLIGSVQTGGAIGRASTSNSTGRQVERRKQVMFSSSVQGGDDLGRLS